MKGRYSGRTMTIYGHILPGAISIARSMERAGHLTERAKYKLKILDWHKRHGENISLTARHFGLDRKTVRLWVKILHHQGPAGLNEKSRSPKKKRTPMVSSDAVITICKIRKEYPAWSKYKIQEIIHRDYGIEVSASTVGRVLKRRGLIEKKKSDKRRRAALRPRARFPHGFSISRPGDMIQIDVKHITVLGGRKMYQFTAIDVLTKYRVLRIYSAASSRNGRIFLEECIQEFPFPIRSVQTDNGSEFLKEFEKKCKELGIPHYFTYPRSPKQNTYVERSHGCDEDEFYRFGNVDQNRKYMDQKIQEWQDIWNAFRPHQALDYRTPLQYLEELKLKNLPTKDVIILQT